MSVRPFQIHVPEAEIEDLHARLGRTRWPDAIEGAGWAYGMDDAYLRSLLESWSRFDWRAREAELNALPHFKAEVDGEEIHFLHVRGRGPRPFPLVLSHGWPSSFIEWLDVLGPLSDPAAYGGDPADAFDLVIPSLPGYGFSAIPRARGMTPRRIAGLWAGLMDQLGYRRFAAHGCDWGAYVTALLGLDHPDRVSGVHMGLVPLSAAPGPGPRPPRSAEDEAYARRRSVWSENEYGYVAIQSTKPQTLAYGLADSPAGTAAWIAEKWRAWTDRNGPPESAIPRETLLTNLSIYWFTQTLNSANRLYYESRKAEVRLTAGQRVEAPTGFFLETPSEARADAHSEPDATPRAGAPPRARVEAAFNVQRWFQAPHGGHFPALETPQMLTDEIRAFFRERRA